MSRCIKFPQCEVQNYLEIEQNQNNSLLGMKTTNSLIYKQQSSKDG